MTNAIQGQLTGAGNPPPTDVGQGDDAVMSSVAQMMQGMTPEEQGDHLTGLGKTLKSFGQLQQNLKDSPLAQRMFQEKQKQQMMQQQMVQAQDMQQRRSDMATQLLSNAGLL